MAQSGECTVGAAAQSGQLDDKFLMKLSEQLGETLGSQHMQLGVYLSIDPTTVQKLRADSKATVETTFLLMRTWRDSRGKREDSGAMFDEICRALSDLKRPDLTDDVRREQVRHLSEKLLKAKETTRSNRQKFNEQMKLVKEELRGAKGEVESCRQKYDETVEQLNEELRLSKDEAQKTQDVVRQLNEQVRLLKDEAQKNKAQMKLLKEELRGAKAEVESCRQKYDVPATSPAVFPSASSKKERKERLRQLTEIARSGKPAKERTLDILRLLREYGAPQLWHEVSHHIVSRGQLDISGVITAANLPDLEFLLISGEASDVTSLKLGDGWSSPTDVFADDDTVQRLCRGLEGMKQLKTLDLTRTGLTDAGLTRVCRTVTRHCRQLTCLSCYNNPGVTDGVGDVLGRTLRDLSVLTIGLYGCRLSTDVGRRLKAEFPRRISVI